MNHVEASDRIVEIELRVRAIQNKHGHRFDGPAVHLRDCAASLQAGMRFASRDAVFLRGLIATRRNTPSAYHSALVPVLEEALAVLDEVLTGNGSAL